MSGQSLMLIVCGGVILVLVVGNVAFKLVVRRWLVLSPGEIRPPVSTLAGGLYGLAGGVAFGALAAVQVDQPNELYGLALALLAVGGALAGNWARSRAWIDEDGIRLRSSLGAKRFIPWSHVACIRGRYWLGMLVIEPTAGRPSIIACGNEGAEALLESAWRREIRLENFEPFVRAGKLVLPERS